MEPDTEIGQQVSTRNVSDLSICFGEFLKKSAVLQFWRRQCLDELLFPTQEKQTRIDERLSASALRAAKVYLQMTRALARLEQTVGFD